MSGNINFIIRMEYILLRLLLIMLVEKACWINL